MHRSIRYAAIAAAALITAVTLTACSTTNGGSDHDAMPGMAGTQGMAGTPAPSGATAPHNQADVSFVTGMIPHHGQAVTMAELAAGRATTPDVRSLASTIKAAQAPEITTMSGWLAAWGQPVPAATGGHDMPGMGGMDDQSGMMTDQQMQQLAGGSGSAFDRMWLQMMIAHHRGAVSMSRTELTAGQNGDVKQLAQRIIDSQSAEIATMTQLLPTVGG
ncbi:MAG: DUF305 domain-containing protein [Lapillicoccus sp.]